MGFGIYKFRTALLPLYMLVIACRVIDCFSVDPLSMRFVRTTHRLQNQGTDLCHYNGYETHDYTQLLDHFTFASEPPTFQQTYLVNTTFWGGPLNNSPIFVYLGGETCIGAATREAGGLMVETAPHFKALILFLEHRYYGVSMPDLVGNVSNPVINASTAGYLTSEQALADYATLITDFKKNLSAENCPVIAFGGSYAGMLAAWLRLKYPQITAGALASSAPILMFDSATPDYDFYTVVAKDFKDTSKRCYRTIKNSWTAMDKLASQPGGLQNLSNIFNTCTNLSDVRALEIALIGLFTDAAQFNYTFVKWTCMTCFAIDSAPKGTDVLGRVSAGANFFVGAVFNLSCVPITISPLIKWMGNSSLRAWTWQSCTEMVFQIGQNPNKTMFPLKLFDLKTYADNCKIEFGVLPRPNWVTTEYGGHDIRKVLKHFGSNIIFSNGLRDPLSSGGVVENISESIVALPTEEGTHGQDLLPSSPDDPEWLKEQRSKEIKIMKSWIEKYNDEFLHK